METTQDLTNQVLAKLSANAWQTPSQVGKRAHLTTHETWRILQQLVKAGDVKTTGNGAWMKYRLATDADRAIAARNIASLSQDLAR